MDMVRCMLVHSLLLDFLQGDVLRTIACILNQVPNKSVPKILYKLLNGKRLTLNHFHVQVYKAKVKPYNFSIKKLDSKTISSCFIRYCNNLRGCKFYCPAHSTKVVESDRTTFFEDELNNGSQIPRLTTFRKEDVIVPLISKPIESSSMIPYVSLM